MSPKRRMRWSWWKDAPRNVSENEYAKFELLVLGAIASGGLAVISLVMGLTGQALKTSQELAQVEQLSVQAASEATTNRDLIKLEGYLVADNPPTMPDDPALQVIQGKIALTARNGPSAAEETIQKVLFTWEAAVEQVFLSDGETRIPLAIALEKFPLPAAQPGPDQRPKIERTGESARLSKPKAITYADQTFPLTAADWGRLDYITTDLDRRVLPHGQTVTVVAALRDQQLVDPLGGRLKIALGTEADIRRTGERFGRILTVIWLPLAIASYLCGKKAAQLNQEFLERSQQ